MKLFFEETPTKSNNRFKFRGNYTFRILNDLKNQESLIHSNADCQLNSFISNNINDTSLEINSLEKDLYLADSCFNASKASNDSFGFSLDSQLLNQSVSQENCNTHNNKKKSKYIKINFKHLKQKKNCYNIGRWTEDEHRRFIEAILKHGNEWKSVQKHIKTRSSTQSRSHSQKFFLKIKNYDLFDFKDRKPCINSLNELAKNLNEKERDNMLELLISYEYHDVPDRKSQCEERLLNRKRKQDLVNHFDFELDDENLNLLTNGGYSNITRMSKNTSSSTPTKDKELAEEKNDEFQDQFFNVFLNSRLRRNSFEDNILVLYADAILIDKSLSQRKKSFRRVEQDIESSSLADSLIEFDQGFIMV
jgi:SHAQKYF class myb-like DNA-binding protein